MSLADTITALGPGATPEGWRLRPDTLAERWSYGSWRAAPHHRLLATKIVECVGKPDGRLIVSMPPRHGKSELISKYTPAWILQLWPWWKVLLASYGSDFASEWGAAARDLIIEHGESVNVEVSADTRAKNKWLTTAGGGMFTAGLDGVFTGRGGNVIIIDDPVKNWLEANSVVSREHAWNWYLSVARSRCAPGASIIVVMTRWHEDDLAGRLEKASKDQSGEKWEILKLPALADEDETYTVDYAAQADGELKPEMWVRATGTALWEAQYSHDSLTATRRTVGPVVWAGLYQQRPSPGEGSILKRQWWKRYHGLPGPEQRTDALISVDSSFKGLDDSDYVVIQVWHRFGARKFLITQYRARMDYPTFKRSLRDVAVMHPECRKIVVEDSANGPAVVADLLGSVSGLVLRRAQGSKESRAHAVSGDIESGNVFIPDVSVWAEVVDFVEECAVFPRGLNDDQVDAMTQALLEWPNELIDKQQSYSPMAFLRGRGR